MKLRRSAVAFALGVGLLVTVLSGCGAPPAPITQAQAEQIAGTALAAAGVTGTIETTTSMRITASQATVLNIGVQVTGTVWLVEQTGAFVVETDDPADKTRQTSVAAMVLESDGSVIRTFWPAPDFATLAG